MRILLVEDDYVSARGVALSLKKNNIITDITDNSEEAISLIKYYDYDLLIIDLILQDIEGYDLIKKIRSIKEKIPIMIVSGLSRPQAKIKGFELGADDFMTKPFDKDELFARINAIVRRNKGFSNSEITFSNVKLNLEKKQVYIKNNIIHLTSKEYLILEILILRKGMVITKEVFLNHLYGGIDEPEMKIIDVFVCKLRKKLSKFGESNIISTVWGRGYSISDKLFKNNSYSFVNENSISAPIQDHVESG